MAVEAGNRAFSRYMRLLEGLGQRYGSRGRKQSLLQIYEVVGGVGYSILWYDSNGGKMMMAQIRNWFLMASVN